MKIRHLLNVRDLSAERILEIFRKAKTLRKQPVPKNKPLAGKTLGLLFHKPSVRTRLSFEVGMSQLGGSSIYIGPVELEGGKRESAKDMARVLSRYLDGIVARTFAHQDVVEMAQWADIPVINGLSDASHPCQALADFFTIQEKLGNLKGIRIAYVGDGNNVCYSLIEAATLLGADLRIATPPDYEPSADLLKWAGSRVRLTQDPKEAVNGASVVYTDVWTSMGQEKEKTARLQAFRPFQVNAALMKQAWEGALFMHCLPAHRGEEVTDEVMDSARSIVYDQAENRLHVQKAILLALMGDA